MTSVNVNTDTGPVLRSGDVPLSGWTILAGILLIVAGLYNVVTGLELVDKGNVIDSTAVLLTSNLDFWGWLLFGWGAVQTIGGCLALANRSSGRAIGTLLACVALFVWFFLIFVAPIPALVGILMNVAIIYGMTTGEDRATGATLR